MNTAEIIAADQTERLQALDPMLPAWSPPESGEVLTGRADGEPVAGVLLHSEHPPTSLSGMWSASRVSELVPLLGNAGPAGMDALLRAWHARLPTLGLPERDSACVVSWPSRDAQVGRVLLDHGFVPLSVLAIRAPLAAPAAPATPWDASGGPAGVTVRRAEPADLDDCLRLAMAEQSYSALVGGAMVREKATGLKRGLLQARLVRREPIWVAEAYGTVAGLFECGYADAAPGGWTASRLRPGTWGYINCASVLPTARGRGVGRALSEHVHSVFASTPAVGSYLYYNPPNPLSSVFWPRQGYRPLWTIWEVRPALALR